MSVFTLVAVLRARRGLFLRCSGENSLSTLIKAPPSHLFQLTGRGTRLSEAWPASESSTDLSSMDIQRNGFAAIVALSGCLACTGDLVGAGGRRAGGQGATDSGDGDTSTGSGQIGNGLTGDDWEASPFSTTEHFSPTARLSRRQYTAVVQQAFGDTLMIPELPGDEEVGLHRHPEAAPLAEYERYVDAAIRLGESVAPSLVAACDFGAEAKLCSASELTGPLQTLYRGEVSAADTDALAAIIDETAVGLGAEGGVAHGVALALLNPRFLYRFELSPGGVETAEPARVSEHELASRLSFSAWHGAPDRSMFDLATQGLFESSLAQESRRAFAGPDIDETIWQFVRTWLRLGDSALESDPLKLAMLEETKRFVQHVLVDENAPFEDLFTAKYSFIDARLAAHYGVPAPAADWDRYEFPEGAKRYGILTHGSFLTANSAHDPDIAWIFRGKVVFEHLFCGNMPAPPEGVASQVVESRVATLPCANCHSVVDPMGQFFDVYDEVGVLRGEGIEGGSVSLGSDIDQDYGDLASFLEALSGSRALSHCFVRHWFRAALGRELSARDQPSLDVTVDVFVESRSIRLMLESLAGTEAFSTIYPRPFESLCQ